MNKESKNIKTYRRAGKYFIVGVSLTIFNYILYSIIANLIINNNDMLWLSSFIATFITTILAYILHSRITWKERTITKSAIYKFFIWNALLTFAINPGLTQLFSFITPLYDLAYNICQAIHINFSFEFIQSTGAFVLMGIVNMIMNFLLYDKFVFDKTNEPKKEEEE
ncbi:GtrA family protein [Candidatus Saccharibacteria bacterium]|nr:GtrA family protein [Candidatus Saccharibacteria bacterium]